jgi:protein phosphatase
VAERDHDSAAGTAPDSLEAMAAKFFGPPAVPARVTLGAMSHPGKVRRSNEDHYLVVRRRRSREVLLTNLPEGLLAPSHDDAYVMAVADGVGGAAFGEIASMLALRTGWILTGRALKWHFSLTEREADELAEMAKVYGRLIHRALRARAEAEPELRGMGTTVTAALTVGLEAVVCHVGDSRAYRLHGGSLERLTHDHTLGRQLVEQGAVSSIEDVAPHLRNVLVNCLGGRGQDVQVDTHRVELADGDRLLLCTDGLTDLVDEAAIARTLTAHDSPQDVCQALVELALDRGGKDNVTVVVARYQV